MSAEDRITEGDTLLLTARVTDAKEHVLTGETVTWTSNETEFVTVDGNTGLVTALIGGGKVSITAR